MLKLLYTHLVPSTSSSVSKVFNLKVKADYNQWLAVLKIDAGRKEAAKEYAWSQGDSAYSAC